MKIAVFFATVSVIIKTIFSDDRNIDLESTVSYVSLNSMRPQYVFTLHSNNTGFTFDLEKESHDFRDFKISISIEKMSFAPSMGRSDAFLAVRGQKNRGIKFNSNINNVINNFQTVREVIDGESSFTVSAEGDWTNVNATVVASMYYEVTGGCRYCAEDFFCCGFEGSSCRRDEGISNYASIQISTKFRCILKNSVLIADQICNGHPNCGFFCNADESGETCTKSLKINVNRDYIWIVCLVIVLIAFILTPCVVMLLHFYYTSRRNSITNQDVVQSHTIPEYPDNSSQRETEVFTVSSPVNDLPPTYEELQAREKDVPPPLYSEAILPVSSSLQSSYMDLRSVDLGVVNLAFENDSKVHESGNTTHKLI